MCKSYYNHRILALINPGSTSDLEAYVLKISVQGEHKILQQFLQTLFYILWC